jgi:endonuclease G, mitochondrial
MNNFSNAPLATNRGIQAKIRQALKASAKRSARVTFTVFALVLFSVCLVWAAISLSTTSAVTQNFDGIGTTATASLPVDFKVDKLTTVRTVGTYAAAVTATNLAGGANLSSTAANGIYNFGSGTTTTGADRAIGFLSSGSGTTSGNLYAQFINNTGGNLAGLSISYDVEKYRGGTNAAGFRMQLFYSTDGTSWTSAGSDFFTGFSADASNAGFATAPGASVSIVNKTLSVTIANGSDFYLAWNYSVTSGSTTTNSQALAIDNISILGVAGGGQTSPSGSGSANPGSLQAGNSTLLTVAVTPGSSPTSTGLTVTGNLSAIGESAAQTFFDDGTHGDVTIGDNLFSFQATVAASTSGGNKSLPVTINDAEGRTGNASISLNVLAPTPPSGVGAATPGNVQAGDLTRLTVNLTPGTNPTSTGITVNGDLSVIGGAAAQPFFDNGTNGDLIAGDQIYTFSATVANTTTVGLKSLPISIADAQSRSAATTISLTVQAAPVLPGQVVISQVYGGGGNSGATLINDFVELFNRSSVAIDITGWSIQYSSAAGTSWQRTNLSGVIPSGGYYLVQEGAGSGGTVNLPTPDATGTIAMAAGAGKIALVNNSTTLTGACPAGSSLIDFVGYGSNASCFEGSGPTEDLGNTLAAFRTHLGCKDVDDNAGDFKINPPAPRNSASPGHLCPAGDLEPEVFTTTPGSGANSVPIDTNITIRFDEPVTVTGTWFSISGSLSGNHTATVSGGPTLFTLDPDANFVPLEQVTITLIAAQISDQDSNDPPDNLAGNYVWTFGSAHDSAEHLVMGNPSAATTDIQNETNFLMQKVQYALSYHRFKGIPNWTSWHLDSSWIGSTPRQDDFRNDTELPAGWYQVLGTDYSGSGFDRGHMCPSADRTASVQDNSTTFLMTNMVPQAPDNNQGPWAQFENYLRTIVGQGNELYIISGGSGSGGIGSNGPASVIANGQVNVPEKTWKVILVLPAGEDDVNRVNNSTRTLAVIMPNVQGIRNDPWQKYLATVDQVEALSGYDFFSTVNDAVEPVIEAKLDPENDTAPVAADQNLTTAENNSLAITLTASDANVNNTFSFTVVNGPLHGTLSGTGANRIYQPAVDYSGPDSFTFKANDGALDSQNATLMITVTEVNAAPIASTDSKQVNQNASVTFPASDLTVNDSPGAGESNQTLTVTAVTATAGTHGSVVLTSGVITYTPDTNYSGSASFNYTVCDNGTTAGAPNSLCTTGLVNVTVSLVDTTPPVITVPSNITIEASSATGAVVTFTASAVDQLDGPTPVNCLPPSGSLFSLGTTTVQCTSTDAHNNTGSNSFQVIVRDTTPPSLTLPANIAREATSSSGTIVTYTASAMDIVDGSVAVSCTPASGMTFPLGTMTVNCSATDGHQNTRTGSFLILVGDTTPPVLTLPANLTAKATSPTGAVVTYTATAVDLIDGYVPVICSPASGSTFAVGVVTVTCSAIDARHNTRSGSFTVTVLGARAIKENVLSQMMALRLTVTDPQDGQQLDKAISRLNQSLDPSLWLDQIHLESKNGNKVFDLEKDAVNTLVNLQKNKRSNISDAVLQGFINDLVGVDRLLALVAINDAVIAGIDSKKLEEARGEVAKGDADAAKGKYENAIGDYKNAWKKTQDAMGRS